jgi:hypothetical protein
MSYVDFSQKSVIISRKQEKREKANFLWRTRGKREKSNFPWKTRGSNISLENSF